MLLNKDEIQLLGLVENSVPESFRNAGYDIRIGKMLILRGDEAGEVSAFSLPPQGMIEVISQERLRLPDHVGGYATVKTSLCNQGIMALNIGLLDPGYRGLVSSTLINFSRDTIRLRANNIFLRLTFHRFDPVKKEEDRERKEERDEEYIQRAREKVEDHFSETFLNLKARTKEVARDYVLGNWHILVGLLTGAGLFLALFSTLTTWAANWITERPQESRMAVEVRLTHSEYEELKSKILSLEKQLLDLQSKKEVK